MLPKKNVAENVAEIEKVFFEKLSQNLEQIKDGFYYLAGMTTDNKTLELVFGAEG